MMKRITTTAVAGGVLFAAAPMSARAEIEVLHKNATHSALLSPLSLKVGGSIRPELIFNSGPEPGYDKNGHDGGTRFRFSADYALTSHTSVIGYYEWGVDLAHALKWDGHYNKDGKRDYQRQLYTGIKDDRYGTLTWGHQWGIYYEVVGLKSDVWDNDGHAGGTGIGINGDYDGGNRPKNSIKYVNAFGPVTLYANYLLPEDETPAGDGLRYRRNNGGGLGLDFQLTPTLVWSAAYSVTRATIKSGNTDSKAYHQTLSGTALTWQPGNWYLVGTASYYKDYVPSTRANPVNRYFAGAGYGLESFAGYTFKFNKPYLKSIQPYLAVDSLRLKGNEGYHANHVYLGAGTTIGYGLSVFLERTIAASSDKEPDATWVTVFYDF